jgi:tyrosyl-tRNA synthetase
MDKEKIIDDIFSRGIGEFVDPDGSFRQKLLNNPNDVVIKLGADPTRPDLHIGHAVIFRKLRKLQDLGAKIIFLIGDYTTMIGDPTGKSKVRPEISQQEIEKNAKTYIDQVGKILLTDEKHFSWIRNSDWFLNVTDIAPNADSKVSMNIEHNGKQIEGKVDPSSFVGKAVLFNETRMQKTHLHKPSIYTVSFTQVLSVLRRITHSNLIARDMFQDRIKAGEELYMHEMLYPVMQGIDSSILALVYGSCDLEVGGTDQTFNMLIGRDIMKISAQKPQAVATFKLLEGTDGSEKMSKSMDNYIAITDTPSDMYGKVMSIPDSSLTNYFELCTYTPIDRIAEIKKEIESGKVNPKDIKMDLARQIVAEYHGENASKKAEEDFITKFQKKEIPDEIGEIVFEDGENLGDVLLRGGQISSKNEWRRLVEEGGITDVSTKEKITDPHKVAQDGQIIKIGKYRFAKTIIK